MPQSTAAPPDHAAPAPEAAQPHTGSIRLVIGFDV